MVDLFALLLTHGLIALAVLRLLGRADLDGDPDVPRDPPARGNKRKGAEPVAPVRRAMVLPNQPATPPLSHNADQGDGAP